MSQLRSRVMVGACGAICALALGLGCTSRSDDCKLNRDCPPDGSGGATGGIGGTDGGLGGSGGATGSGGDGGVCDTTKGPSEEACLVSDEYAVFVAPGDGTAGTMTEPSGSLTDALALAKQRKLEHVIVCAATYDEKVILGEAAGGIQVHGGFACPGEAEPWSYDASKKTKVAPSAPGYALEVKGVGDVLIEDIEFEAQSGTAPGESSIAGFVSEASDVVLRRVVLKAAAGANGSDGTREDFAYPEVAELKGNNADDDAGGMFRECTCPDGSTTLGAQGGNGGMSAAGGGMGLPDWGAGEASTVGQACSPGEGSGGNGAPGPSGADGAGAMSLGTLTTDGWQPTDGANGETGKPGQGGGGGAGSSMGGGGGGGGCGGCGGALGSGGTAGGSSIALLAFDSQITLQETELIAADAGDGGAGAAGQEGQSTFGAPGTQADFGCAGGTGAPGGNGGAGGGAAGGISAGLVYAGDVAPTLTDVTTTLGAPGDKGIGGKPGENDGIDGVAVESLELE